MSPATVVAHAPVFASVRSPHLTLEPEDVWPCETCEEHGHAEDCHECQGHRLVHGYDANGEGMPVDLAGWLPAAAQCSAA